MTLRARMLSVVVIAGGMFSPGCGDSDKSPSPDAGMESDAPNPAPDAPVENMAPNALDDSADAESGVTVVVNVLANDVDPNGDEISLVSTSDPGNGTVIVNGDGTVSYTANTDFVGDDSLTYSISDGRGGTDEATLRIAVSSARAILSLAIGDGGQVASRFNELVCRGTCEQSYEEETPTMLTLTAISDAGYRFVGWTGACSGTETCTVTMTATGPDVAVTAQFEATGLPYVACPTQNTGPMDGGTATLEAIADFVVLCDGWMLYAERTNNRLVLRNVIDQTEARSYQLSSVPRNIALDRKHGLAYVAYTNTQTLARVDLTTGEVRDLWIGDTVESIAVSAEGVVFLASGSSAAVRTLNGARAEALGTRDLGGQYIDYNDATDRLITSTRNYFYDHASDTFSEQGASAGAGSGSDCRRVYVSPDGNHAAKPCGGGNGAGYSIYDFYSHDPSIVQGEWLTGPYPSGAAFSPNSKYALLTDRSDLQLFSVETHALLTSWRGSTCAYNDLRKLGVSLDSRYVIGITTCGFDDDYTVVTWQYYDTSM